MRIFNEFIYRIFQECKLLRKYASLLYRSMRSECGQLMNVCTEAKADFSDSDNAWKKHLKYQTKTGQFEHTVCNLKEDRTRI